MLLFLCVLVPKPIYSNTATRHQDKNLCVYKWNEISFAIFVTIFLQLWHEPTTFRMLKESKWTFPPFLSLSLYLCSCFASLSPSPICSVPIQIRNCVAKWNRSASKQNSKNNNRNNNFNWIGFNASQCKTSIFNWNSFQIKMKWHFLSVFRTSILQTGTHITNSKNSICEWAVSTVKHL